MCFTLPEILLRYQNGVGLLSLSVRGIILKDTRVYLGRFIVILKIYSYISQKCET